MLLPLLPPPPPPPACSLLRPARPHHRLSSAAAAFLAPLFPARLLRSRASSSIAQLASHSPNTPVSLPLAFSFAASALGRFQRNPSPAVNGEDKAEEEDEGIVGDCLVFEEGAFEGGDPFLSPNPAAHGEGEKRRRAQWRKPAAEVNAEDLVPEKWREVVADINLTKKEKRRIAQELKFGSRVERRKKLPVPDLKEYRSYRAMKLSQLKPVVLDNPRGFPPPPPLEEVDAPSGGRVPPRNPRLAVGAVSLEVIADFFNSDEYVPGETDDDKKPDF